METNGSHEVAKAPTEPPAAGRQSEVHGIVTIVEAIEAWQKSLEQAADLKRDAEVVEANAILQSQAKNEAGRKAEATLASADLYARAEKAKARALAAEAIVVALVGHPIGGRR